MYSSYCYEQPSVNFLIKAVLITDIGCKDTLPLTITVATMSSTPTNKRDSIYRNSEGLHKKSA